MGKEKIKQILGKTKIGEDLLFLNRMHKSQEYRQWNRDYIESNTFFKFQEFGDLNENKCLYVINCFNQTSGFFCSWHHVCRGLIVAERFGFTPVVDWTNGPYYDVGGWQGYMNPFEYFFDPVSSVPISDILKSKNVTFYSPHTCGDSLALYDLKNEENINRLVRANSKYLHIRSELQSKINSEIDALLNNKKTLAIHIRGVEWGHIKGHPMPVSLASYADKIDEEMDKYEFEQIFVATDSEEALCYFKNRYGKRIVSYNDVIRTPKGSKKLAILDDEGVHRDHNGFWLGYEVLKDMLTLSMCDGLIAGLSYVSFAAEIFKRGRGEIYQSKTYVEQKIQKYGKSPLELLPTMKKEDRR